jgi:hypothetical protein
VPAVVIVEPACGHSGSTGGVVDFALEELGHVQQLVRPMHPHKQKIVQVF